MKKLIIILISIITSMFAVAQNDTISVIGTIKDIKPVKNQQQFELAVNTLGMISGKIDSCFVLYIHSPAKQLLINDYKNPETYKDKVYYFIININAGKIVFIDAFSANALRGKCTKCNQTLQGFRFLGDKYAHYLFYCPTHGLIDEDREHYE
ncbi:MAG: hypothetical protein K8R54_03405 [Bacteroidales bacterium]|nr:hypothetical protein [Bacteroidales bacterium]